MEIIMPFFSKIIVPRNEKKRIRNIFKRYFITKIILFKRVYINSQNVGTATLVEN